MPKQYRALAGEPVIRPTLAAFLAHPRVGAVQPVIHPDDAPLFRAATGGLSACCRRSTAARPGRRRCAPDWRRSRGSAPDLVLIHDAARPFLTGGLITRAIAAGEEHGAAVPAIAIADTIKTVDEQAMVTETLDRAACARCRRRKPLPSASSSTRTGARPRPGREDFTDDAALAEWAGHRGQRVRRRDRQREAHDRRTILLAPKRCATAALADVRTGNGFDVHAFGDGDHVMLGGVRIPHARGLTGHSDADVALHALVDAILGALADGDIGVHFPPSDPQWRGASSDRFLAFACERVRARGGMIAHLDVTIVCEAPRIGPHRDAMRARIAAIAGIPIDRVAVKATTSEKLGFTGRGEGIVAMATATVRLPWSAA